MHDFRGGGERKYRVTFVIRINNPKIQKTYFRWEVVFTQFGGGEENLGFKGNVGCKNKIIGIR